MILLFGLAFSQCSLLLDWKEKLDYEYFNLRLYQRSKIGGITVYYLENDGRRAMVAFENKLSSFWISEGWENERYSYEAGWIKYHVSEIRSDHITIGWRKP